MEGSVWEHCMNHAEPAMPSWTEADLLELLEIINGPRRRPEILRPRPSYLPHPQRRLPRVQGVVRISGWGLPKQP
jgi:hypothetical protein